MSGWYLIVDVAKCCNCQNCTMAVKDEYVGNDFPGYAAAQPRAGHEWIVIDRHIRGSHPMVDVTYVPRMCNHCDNAPCVTAGAGAVVKRPDGIVIIDPVKAKGRQNIVSSCPYSAIWWNEAAQLPQHWIFDAHLLDQGWREPRCVQACPTGALQAVKTSDAEMAKRVQDENLFTLNEALRGTRPRVYYRNLDRVHRHFVGGNVVRALADGRIDNVEGATVEFAGADPEIQRTSRTDRYGDFRIDGLDSSVKPSAVRVSHPQFGEASVSVTVADSVYLGSIELRPANAQRYTPSIDNDNIK